MKNNEITITYSNKKCFVEVMESEGDIFIELYSVRGKKFQARASVVVGMLPPGHVAIKDYSENSGMLQLLLDAKIVDKPINYYRSGFVEIPICPVLVPTKEV